jgi:hypothetical protein
MADFAKALELGVLFSIERRNAGEQRGDVKFL